MRTAAGEAGLDPYLVLAVIRQESHFEEQAESHAGALGVMQIMPRTGRSLASKVGMGDFEKGLLADPEVSIRMGSCYLGEQMRSFASGRTREVGFELGLAAYNAGPSAAKQWVGRLPLDDADALRGAHPLQGDADLREEGVEELHRVQDRPVERLTARPGGLAVCAMSCPS